MTFCVQEDGSVWTEMLEQMEEYSVEVQMDKVI